MKTHDILELYSVETLHMASQNWILELEFIKNEHLFFEDLLKTFNLQLIESQGYGSNSEIVEAMGASKKRNNSLLKYIKKHDRNLKLLVDAKVQPEEEVAYKAEHKLLMGELHRHLKEYKYLKTQLFTNVKEVFKKEKQKRLKA